MTFPSIHHIVLVLFYFSTSVLSSHPVLDIPLSQTNAASPSFTITEILDLNGGATLMPMPNDSPFNPLLALPKATPSPKEGEIAEYANSKPLKAGEIANRPKQDQILTPEELETQRASSSPSFLDDAQFEKAVLNSTNTIRKLHSAPALTWNTTLATLAQNKSALCLSHSSRKSSHGENIALSTTNITSAIESWTLNPSSLKIDITNLTSLEESLSPKTLAKKLQKAKAFTQLIWKNTTTLGCGRTLCSGQHNIQGWLVVCEFDPKGNVIGKFGENVQIGSTPDSAPASTTGNRAGGIAAGKTRPNAGAIGEAKSEGRGTVDRVQVWCVFIVVWLVFGAVFS